MSNFLTTILAKAGINVGTATGAAAGEVKASGDVFALGKAKGLQAQLIDYSVVNGSAWVNLTTSYQVLTNCMVTFTPTINEKVVIWTLSRLNCGATAATVAADVTRSGVYLNAASQSGGGSELIAPGSTGEFYGNGFIVLSLTANTAYTIDMRMCNLSGARGAGLGQMMYLRLAA